MEPSRIFGSASDLSVPIPPAARTHDRQGGYGVAGHDCSANLRLFSHSVNPRGFLAPVSIRLKHFGTSAYRLLFTRILHSGLRRLTICMRPPARQIVMLSLSRYASSTFLRGETEIGRRQK